MTHIQDLLDLPKAVRKLLQQVHTGEMLRWMVPFLGGESPLRERGAR